MQANNSPLFRAGCLAGLSLAMLVTRGLAAEADAFPTFENYIKISGQTPWISGSGSTYQARARQSKDGGVGIEDLHYARDFDKGVSLELNGRALAGSEDYLLQLKTTKEEVGSVDIGYKRFRTFYDGIGGFFPKSNLWLPLGDRELHTDRGSFWANFTIARPNAPVIRLNYRNELRDGKKDSTIWGESDFTGIGLTSTPARKVVPGYIELNERQQTLDGSVVHTVGKTALEAGFVLNKIDNNDSRFLNRYPGELRPYPTITATSPSQANNRTYGFDKSSVEGDTTSFYAKATSEVNEKLTVFAGIKYDDYSADIAGDRRILVDIATATGVVSPIGAYTGSGRPPYSYSTNDGATEQQTLTANAGLNFKASSDLNIGLAVKGEKITSDGHNDVTYISTLVVPATGATTQFLSPAHNESRNDEKAFIPELEVRYTGIKSVALYGSVDYHLVSGADETFTFTGIGTGTATGVPTSTNNVAKNLDKDHGNFKVGANWTVNSTLTLRAEIFQKNHRNDFTGYGASAGSRFVLKSNLTGGSVSAVVKPIATLTFNTRYVGQQGKLDTTVDSGSSYDSGDATINTFAESITWSPSAQIYVQLNGNLVFNTLQTAYPVVGGLANDVVRNADNNYFNGSVVTGFVVSKNTDATVEYSWYRSDNYDPSIPASFAYGQSTDEDSVTFGIKHKFSKRLIGNAKFGYIDSRSDTTGGNTDYHGPLAYLSLTYSL